METAVEEEPQNADPQVKYDEPARNSGDFNEDEVDYGEYITVDELVTKVRDELIEEEGGGRTYDSTIVAYVPEFQAANLYELQPAECIDNSPDQMVAIAMRQVVRLAKSRVNWDRSSDEVRKERAAKGQTRYVAENMLLLDSEGNVVYEGEGKERRKVVHSYKYGVDEPPIYRMPLIIFCAGRILR